jgi:hypothetical protein
MLTLSVIYVRWISAGVKPHFEYTSYLSTYLEEVKEEKYY